MGVWKQLLKRRHRKKTKKHGIHPPFPISRESDSSFIVHKVPVCVFLYRICSPSPARTLLNWSFRGAVGLFTAIWSLKSSTRLQNVSRGINTGRLFHLQLMALWSTRWHSVNHSGWSEFQGDPFYGESLSFYFKAGKHQDGRPFFFEHRLAWFFHCVPHHWLQSGVFRADSACWISVKPSVKESTLTGCSLSERVSAWE